MSTSKTKWVRESAGNYVSDCGSYRIRKDTIYPGRGWHVYHVNGTWSENGNSLANAQNRADRHRRKQGKPLIEIL